MHKPMLLMAALAVLSACVSDRQERAVQSRTALSNESKTFAWARLDGQRITDNPDLTAQAQTDLAACKAETPPVAAVGVRGEVCMTERGYYVREVDR
jgi:hypothetical protein